MRALLLLALSGLIIACGQKGPLYLPDAEPPPADTCTTCPPVILPAPTASEATPAASSEAYTEQIAISAIARAVDTDCDVYRAPIWNLTGRPSTPPSTASQLWYKF